MRLRRRPTDKSWTAGLRWRMRFSLTFRIAAAFLISLISLVALAIISYRHVVALNRDVGWVAHSYEVLQAKEGLARSRAEMEAGARGYLIVGSAEFRNQALTAGTETVSLQRKLVELTADNPPQQARIDRFGVLLLERRAMIDRLLQLRTEGSNLADGSLQRLVQEGFAIGRSLSTLSAE